MKKGILLITAIALLLTGLPARAQDKVPKGFSMAARNEALALYVNRKDGRIILHDLAADYSWHSNPQAADKKAKGAHRQALLSQIILTYANERGTSLSAASAAEAVKQGGLQIDLTDDGFSAAYDFVKPRLRVRLVYQLRADHLSVSLPVSGLEAYPNEDGSENLNSVTSVDILPAFGSGGPGDEGWLLVPDGSGALIRFNNGVTSMMEYSASLYGKDAGVEGQVGLSAAQAIQARTLEQTARLPVFATRIEEADGRGLLGIITQNDAKAAILARGANLTSYNYAWSRFRVRNGGSMMMNSKEFGASVIGVSEREGLTTGSYEVRYYPLSGEKASCAGMAGVYRDYLLKEQGLARRVAEGQYPLYLELYGQVKKAAQLLGIPYTKTVDLTTVGDIRDLTGRLGVDQCVVRYAHWSPGSYYEKIPLDARLSASLGSMAEMKALADELEDRGGGLYPAADLINVYQEGRGYWAIRDAVLTPVNSPQMQFEMNYANKAANLNVPPWTLLSPARFVQFYARFFRSFEQTGLPGLALDAIADVCSSDNRSGGTGRGEVPALAAAVLRRTDRRLMLSGGNAYAATLASHLLTTPAGSSGYSLADETVPFYQMVFHGYVPYGIGLANHSADPEAFLLRCLEYGASPQYAFVARNAKELADSRLVWLYSPDFTVWEEAVRSGYQRLHEVLAPLARLEITAHENLPGQVSMTEYGGRTRVYVNHARQEAQAEGHVIPARSFVVVEVDHE